MKNLIYLFLTAFLFSCETNKQTSVEVKGDLMQWHKVSLILIGPETSEWAKENPFLDYKLEATFTKGNKSFTVPGYFAADGNAGETSAETGNIWKIHFRPDEAGSWNYKISFRKGKNIVVVDGDDPGESLALDGKEGTIEIIATDKTGNDFRSKGRIVNGEKAVRINFGSFLTNFNLESNFLITRIKN